MKKKLMITCITLLLIIGSTANAAVTSDTIEFNENVWQNVNVSEDFQLDFALPAPITVTAATLKYKVYDVKLLDSFPLSLNGTSFGNLKGSENAWAEKTVDVLAAIDGSTETPTLSITGFPGDGTERIKLDYATLEVTYIPAPGAVMLGSIGVGFVGWLRRRRTL